MKPASPPDVRLNLRCVQWARVALAGGLFALALASPAVAKSYRVESLIVDARVESNGALRVEEAITYRFDGRFKFAYRDIPTSGDASIAEVAVRETGTSFAASTGESPGTFNVTTTDDGIRVTWYYRAHNESRTFRLAYTVNGATRRHPDTSELYFNLVGTGWDRPIGRVHATLHLPGVVPATEIRAWAHGPLHGLVLPPQDSTIVMNVSPLPARTFFDARVLFPATALAGATETGVTGQLDIILAEERNWAEEANARRDRARQRANEQVRAWQARQVLAWQLLPYALFAGLVAATVWVLLWRAHGRPHAVDSTFVAGEIPSGHPPAVISTLAGKSGSGVMLAATLLDLARRGHFVIKEEQQQTSGWFGRESTKATYTFSSTGKDIRDLLPFEASLRDFVLREAGNGDSFEMDDLKALARKSASRFRRWLMAWNKEVREHVSDLGLREPVSGRAVVLNLLSGFLVAGAGGVMLFFTRSPLALFAIVPGVLQMILTASLQRLTPTGRQLRVAWRAFAAHLKAIGRGLGPPRLNAPSWERYLVLAVMFGLHEKVLPHLRLPPREAGSAYPVWYSGVYHGGSVADSVAGLSHGITAMASAVSSTASSAAGTGGGASVGGGGGAGGGGGGAG